MSGERFMRQVVYPAAAGGTEDLDCNVPERVDLANDLMTFLIVDHKACFFTVGHLAQVCCASGRISIE